MVYPAFLGAEFIIWKGWLFYEQQEKSYCASYR